MTKKILFLTDSDFNGSGYFYISMPLCKGLAELGHDVKVVGMGYTGQEHTFPFSIIPCGSFKDAVGMVHNLNQPDLWGFDILIVAMDIPIQIFLMNELKNENIKRIAITPLENPPLMMTWANSLAQMDGVFFISQIATDAAHEAGLAKAQHLQIGVDTVSWRLPKPEERKRIRESMGFDDKFVVLTVADNQERKNPSYGYDIISKVKKAGIPVKYIHVTRENNAAGLNLRDYAHTVGLTPDDYMIIERGIPSSELMSLYFAADAFLLPTKAEGLGLILLEAMATGVPIVATETGAIPELLSNDRGWLVPSEYRMVDVWGNSFRDFINRDAAVSRLKDIYGKVSDEKARTSDARKYVESRTWDIPVKQIDFAVEAICGQEK